LVDPWGLADKDDIWYLMAGTDDGQRTFRIDRVIDAVMTDLDAEHPADFDGPLDDGRIRVRLSAPMAVTIAEHLAGWGAHVEVVKPV
jgi:predicted DNA-binding transcriptional regulator YafY